MASRVLCRAASTVLSCARRLFSCISTAVWASVAHKLDIQAQLKFGGGGPCVPSKYTSHSKTPSTAAVQQRMHQTYRASSACMQAITWFSMVSRSRILEAGCMPALPGPAASMGKPEPSRASTSLCRRASASPLQGQFGSLLGSVGLAQCSDRRHSRHAGCLHELACPAGASVLMSVGQYDAPLQLQCGQLSLELRIRLATLLICWPHAGGVVGAGAWREGLHTAL